MGPTHIHCLHKQSNQILDFEDTLGVVHFVQGFGYDTDGGLTHGVPEFVNLKFESEIYPYIQARWKERESNIHQRMISGPGPVS